MEISVVRQCSKITSTLVFVLQVISLFLLGSYYIFLDNAAVVAVVGLLLYVGCYQVNKLIFVFILHIIIMICIMFAGTFHLEKEYHFFSQNAHINLSFFLSQISFGPIGWLMISEIFPLRLRGRGLSIAVLVNFGANALVTFAFSPLKVMKILNWRSYILNLASSIR